MAVGRPSSLPSPATTPKRARITWNLGSDALTSGSASRLDDLRRAIFDESPNILHIAAHGSASRVVIEGDHGDPAGLDFDALDPYLAGKELDGVVLNSCHGGLWGRPIGETTTIAIKNSISDRSAIEFSRGFYDAIGAGLTIEGAFEEGRHNVQLKGLSGALDISIFQP